jgi:hypothetical protein
MSQEQHIEQQIEISKRLQVLWLKHMEKLLDNGEITSTDMATLARVLLHNGWTLDPKQLPKSLKDMMTKTGLKLVDFGNDSGPPVIRWSHPDNPDERLP